MQSLDNISRNMFKVALVTIWVLVFLDVYVNGCLITNCPRGGKRSGRLPLFESSIKQCLSCGPGHTGQCFGPDICCGPFGCLIGTRETLPCQQEGLLRGREPCSAGGVPCMKNTGRCAAENICCNQDSCHIIKQCGNDEAMKPFSGNTAGLELHNLMNFPSEIVNDY